VFSKRSGGGKSRIQKISYVIAGIFLTLSSLAFAATVDYCSDADTCWVTEAEQKFKIRFADVDAPESDQPYGEESKHFINHLIGGKQVILKCNGQSFDRQTCGIVMGTEDVQDTLVRQGYAWDFPKFSHGKYSKAQSEAMATRRGLWKAEHPTSPHCWRWTGTKECNNNLQYQP
jgi:micrococcal nuclease